TVEIGLVPLGAIGMTAFCVDLYFAQPEATAQAGLTVREFVAAGHWRIIMDLTGIGLFAGLFIVPLFALVQSRTPKAELSRVIAGVNIQNAGFIVVAAMLGVLLQMDSLTVAGVTVPLPGLSIPQLFLALGIANALVAIFIFSLVPEFFLRFLAWIYVSLFYRLRIHGVEDNVPDEGPALLVCNHVSYMDPLVISGAVPRPIRFVMYYRIFNTPGLSWVFKAYRAIPIAGAKEDPAALEAAFEAIDHARGAAAAPLRHVLPDLQHPGPELGIQGLPCHPHRRREGRPGRTGSGLRGHRPGPGRGRAGLHLPGGRADPRWRDRALQARRREDPGAAAGTGGAHGPDRALGQHVEQA